MWTQFYLQYSHFAVHIAIFLILLGVSWLYIDAWSIKKNPKEGLRALGFFLAALSFLFSALSIEMNLPIPTIPTLLSTYGTPFLRGIGFICICVSLLMDPMQPVPKNEGIKNK